VVQRLLLAQCDDVREAERRRQNGDDREFFSELPAAARQRLP
jgi:hypothetical protein